MRSEEFIKCYVRLKPILLGEAAALTAARRDVTISKSRENYSYSKHRPMQVPLHPRRRGLRRLRQQRTDLPHRSHARHGRPPRRLQRYPSPHPACVLAYGQTSSGKTYTMKGTAPHPGLIPLSIKEIFGRIEEQGLLAKVKVRVDRSASATSRSTTRISSICSEAMNLPGT
jgi:hypothetical protein